MRIIKSQRDKIREAQRGNEFVRQMFSPDSPPMDYSDLLKPKRAAPVRDLARVSEADVNAAIRSFSGSRDDIVLWRNNKGMVQIPGGGMMPYGLGPNGASDWIGYRRVVISPDMVGTIIAQFTCVEAKAPDAGPVPEHQQAFLRAVNAAGGIGIVVRDAEELKKL